MNTMQHAGRIAHLSAMLIAFASCHSSPPAPAALAGRGPSASPVAPSNKTATAAGSLVVVDETTRWRVGDPLPNNGAWLTQDELRVTLARGETIAWQFLGATDEAVTVDLALPTTRWRVHSVAVTTPSTSMYGPSRGLGEYLDRLSADDGKGAPLVEVSVPRNQVPGAVRGSIQVGTRTLALTIDVANVTLPPIDEAAWLWAYYDPRELGKSAAKEAQCQAVFRAHGVVASPELTLETWPARRASVRGLPVVPVLLPTEPNELIRHVREWSRLGKEAKQLPFAIPVDEPRSDEARADVVRLATLARQGGSGPNTFLYAVTAKRHRLFGGLVDVYLTGAEVTLSAKGPRWTYNGTPPAAGSMVLDAGSADLRTWGWITERWGVQLWYIWDALYWHDRHNRRRRKEPILDGPPLATSVTFFDGEDSGNMDGVLAYPTDEGCAPSLRLLTLRRGVLDRLLLQAAARCQPAETAALIKDMVPTALGDAKRGSPSWPAQPETWEAARQRALALAGSCN